MRKGSKGKGMSKGRREACRQVKWTADLMEGLATAQAGAGSPSLPCSGHGAREVQRHGLH